jgi:hypothetical protein
MQPHRQYYCQGFVNIMTQCQLNSLTFEEIIWKGVLPSGLTYE